MRDDLNVVIMAGGLGTRTGLLGAHIPKLLMPVNAESLYIDWLQNFLDEPVVGTTVFCLGYHEELIRTYLEANWRSHSKLRLVSNTGGLGTAAPIIRAGLALDEPVLVINGDVIISGISVGQIRDLHESSECDATVLTSNIVQTSPYGEVVVDERMRMSGLSEKPVRTVPILTGVYLLGPRVLSLLRGRKGPIDMPDLLRIALARGLDVMTAPCSSWRDIGAEVETLISTVQRNPATNGSPAARRG